MRRRIFRLQAMSERQQQLARAILKDPDVVSLSSFIGVDGTNPTLNSGRIQINLKPRSERNGHCFGHHPPAAAAACEQVQGITLYMQPVQDLTVEDRVSRTQFQYSMEDTDAEGAFDLVAEVAGQAANIRPQLRDVASDQQNGGLQAESGRSTGTPHRGWEFCRLRSTTLLYDAFGQRQVSTIYTQLNQYHVVLEVDPQFQQDPDALNSLYVKSSTGTQVPLSAFSHIEQTNASLVDQPSGAVSSGDACRSIWRREFHWATRPKRSTLPSRRSRCRPAFIPAFRGRRRRFAILCRANRC